MPQGARRDSGHNDAVNLPLFAIAICASAATPIPPEVAARIDAEVREEHRARWEAQYPARTPKAEIPKKVVARKGPVEIALEVANTKVRTHPLMSMRIHSLWLKVSIKNVGTKPFKVRTEAFRSILELEEHSSFRYEIVDEDGRAVVRERLGAILFDIPPVCPQPPDDPDWERLKPPLTLKPGETLSTRPTWGVSRLEVACLGRPIRSPLDPYAEVLGLTFGKNKRAKIRLVYDYHVPDELRSDPAKPLRPEQVTVATDWIPLEILP